jgi:trk system potassium uptake protein TrkH
MHHKCRFKAYMKFRIKRKNRLKQNSPLRQLVTSFLILIFGGAFLLKLPYSTINGISLVDALFTSTSAVCVTGLIVIDTAKEFTFYGQIIILILIQLGGFGIMTFSIGLFSMFSGDMSLKWRFTMSSLYNEVTVIPPIEILKKIIIYTFTIEAFTAVILYSQFIQKMTFSDALWTSVFHAVSAFCNAGFSTFSDSLISYQDNGIVISAISFAVILGGIGFIVLTELTRMKFSRKKRFFSQFSLHSKIVLATTGILILGGSILFLILEWNYIMKDMPLQTKILTSFMQSITCRTAGFNSIDIGLLRESTLGIMMTLMFIGGSPGSIAGGIKTTTFAVVTVLLISKLKGRNQIVFWNRSINPEAVNKSMTLFILAFVFIYTASITLLSFHSFDTNNSFLQVVFEVISAFSTVGLSTGITAKFPSDGKILLTIIMFVGRIGPFALITAITEKVKTADYEVADENIMIG